MRETKGESDEFITYLASNLPPYGDLSLIWVPDLQN